MSFICSEPPRRKKRPLVGNCPLLRGYPRGELVAIKEDHSSWRSNKSNDHITLSRFSVWIQHQSQFGPQICYRRFHDEHWYLGSYSWILPISLHWSLKLCRTPTEYVTSSNLCHYFSDSGSTLLTSYKYQTLHTQLHTHISSGIFYGAMCLLPKNKVLSFIMIVILNNLRSDSIFFFPGHSNTQAACSSDMYGLLILTLVVLLFSCANAPSP